MKPLENNIRKILEKLYKQPISIILGSYFLTLICGLIIGNILGTAGINICKIENLKRLCPNFVFDDQIKNQ